MIERPLPNSGESPPSKERLILLFAVLNISGLPGTGKTSVAETLGQRLGIEVIDVGQQIRDESEAQTGEKAVGFVTRATTVDQRFDKQTAEIIRNAKTEKPVIITARLAPWIARREEEKSELQGTSFPPIINIVLIANNGIRYQRILEREKVAHPELTLDDVSRETLDRMQRDQEFFHEAHPELEGDPLAEGANYKGRLIYDCVISTDNRSVEEVADEIIGCLLEDGLVVKEVDPPQLPQLPPQGFIFPAA